MQRLRRYILLFGILGIHAYGVYASSDSNSIVTFKEDFTFVVSDKKCTLAGSKFFEAHKTSNNPPFEISSAYSMQKKLDNQGANDCVESFDMWQGIEDGTWGIIDNSNKGGYWANSNITGHTGNAGGSGPYTIDGFLLVNCCFESEDMFTQTVEVCPGIEYNFSAWLSSIGAGVQPVPIQVRFEVYGIDGGSEVLIKDMDTDTYNEKKWKQFSFTFKSGNYSKLRLAIKNSLPDKHEYRKPGGGKGANGNDVGIDDIEFSVCLPEINLFSDKAYSRKDVDLKNCEPSVTLCCNPDEVSGQFMSSYVTLLQSSDDNVNWVNEGSIAANLDFEIPTGKETHGNGRYYRIWIGENKEDVENAVKGTYNPASNCGKLVSVSKSLMVSYSCPKPKLYVTGDSLVCAGEETVLEAHGCDKYQWLDKDGNVVSETEFLTVKTSEEITYTVICLEKCDCDGSTVTDADGNVYPLKKIGGQCWMAENIRATHYDTQSEMAGKEIKTVSGGEVIDPYYVDARNVQGGWSISLTKEHRAKLGLLYNWAAIVGLPSESEAKKVTEDFREPRQGICPNGFHVPTSAEWEELAAFVGGFDIAGSELASKEGWCGSQGYGKDSFGFEAYPGGDGFGANPGGVGGYACLASATAISADEYKYYRIEPPPYSEFPNKSLKTIKITKKIGTSVRCIRNN
ncbi:MAG: fibrobacter succinogenes major paralogous domain-containing protein [Paludibacteraceae bacterium]|nr:fibrobacter succinogenes major paralogous domain-containing protein [Paludibacteraceae bacterium]